MRLLESFLQCSQQKRKRSNMKNEIKDWKEFDLENDEIEMLESIENCIVILHK